MGRIVSTMAALADELRAAAPDLNVVTNPAAINPPCALIEPPTLTRLTSCADSATLTVALLAPGQAGTADALAVLDELLDAVVDVLDPDKIEPATYVLPATAEPAAALLLTLERTTP